MRVLVVAAHPVETSFVSALHGRAVQILRAGGHVVDDCNLYAEAFDPILSRQDRIDYHDTAVNVRNVAPYVRRLQDAEALLFIHPVWNFGFPAILKGFVDRVFVPGIGFGLDQDGKLSPQLTHVKRYGAICTYGASRWTAFLMGDPPRKFMTRGMRGYIPLNKPCTYLACYDMNHTTPERRATFLNKMERGLQSWSSPN
ncbi:NAD(P)H-dependent oxidoreductase [Lichenifustis flavocetrariae]|uniref:NAD(P)H-dependent oxidoreductase n=1 Tax=Lichenifustis flavocetrariae TaxID=2949735 RepID=A0AA41Z2G5_9HYPH|nr:NAD(P)H-dependent oxidoreductase [Lichenifustis flavocetrariae]MCW6511638.1 NAD(P)H-dependent oxidoreductase [Lichenifustis flavocetrariae]